MQLEVASSLCTYGIIKLTNTSTFIGICINSPEMKRDHNWHSHNIIHITTKIIFIPPKKKRIILLGGFIVFPISLWALIIMTQTCKISFACTELQIFF